MEKSAVSEHLMRDALGLEEATVGLKADLPECRQVASIFPDTR